MAEAPENQKIAQLPQVKQQPVQWRGGLL